MPGESWSIPSLVRGSCFVAFSAGIATKLGESIGVLRLPDSSVFVELVHLAAISGLFALISALFSTASTWDRRKEKWQADHFIDNSNWAQISCITAAMAFIGVELLAVAAPAIVSIKEPRLAAATTYFSAIEVVLFYVVSSRRGLAWTFILRTATSVGRMKIWNIYGPLIKELASVINSPEDAKLIATKAGFPRAELPKFTKAIVFWNEVVTDAANGRLAGGVRALAECAAEHFPGNEVFSRDWNAPGFSTDDENH